MVDLTIVHVSDLHFASPAPHLSPRKALNLAASALRGRLGDNTVLVISGDITTAGNVDGYDEARAAIAESLLDAVSFNAVLVCPGNHDLTQESVPFGPFNRFAFQVSHSASQAWNPANTVVPVAVNDYDFLLINSAHHLNYSFGLAPIVELERVAEQSTRSHRIAVLHHSPISSTYGGPGLANAYEFLACASRLSLAGILHGHVHSEQALSIGPRQTFLAGVGSLAFKPSPNMNNQFAVYDLEAGRMVRHTIYRYFENHRSFSAHDVELQ